MEELKNLVGRTVKVTAYIGKEKESLVTRIGIFKSVSDRGIKIESIKTNTILSIPKSKVMIIWSYENDSWKRIWNNKPRKVLWGNAKVFKRREQEINKWSGTRNFINGGCFALFLILLIWGTISFISATRSNNIILNTTSGFNETHFISATRSNNIILNTTSFIPGNTNTNVLTALGWQTLASFWYGISIVLMYAGGISLAMFLLLWYPEAILFNDANYYNGLSSYMRQKFEDELK